MSDTLDYGYMMHKAMQGLLKNILQQVAEGGLPGEHHFFITFDTTHPGVDMSQWIKEAHPEEMTIVMQHWFDDLAVMDDRFTVTLNFNDTAEPMVIPFDAITTFVDPSVEFGLRFDSYEDPTPPEPQEDDTDEAPKGDADVVSLDAFRKN